jgi:hypothetical protein
MGQVLRIFRKDVRHFWIEISASLLVLSAYIWRVLHEWAIPSTISDMPDLLRSLLMALVPISWCLLIVCVIQDESLVGDRQFWITRPYEWKKLLAAKALFVFAFVNVPLFAANAIFLWNSGFSPTRHLAGLLWIQLAMIVVLVLPAAVVAVVTSTIVQVVLWVLGIGTFIGGMAYVSSLIPDPHIPTSVSDSSDLIAPVVLGLVCLGLVVWQYARRRAWTARSVIAGVAVVLAVSAVVPSATQKQVTQAYPALAAGEKPPFRLTPIARRTSTENRFQSNGEKVELGIPIRFTSVAPSSLVVVAGTRAAIQTRNGKHFSSKWANDRWELWPGEENKIVALEVDSKFFEQSRFDPADIRITFAFTEYHELNTRQIVTAAGEFPVDGGGICWVGLPLAELQCRWPLNAPQMLAHYDTSTSTCPADPNNPTGPATRYASYLDEYSVEPAIIPVQTSDFYLGRPGVCPGTPITLGTPVLTRRASTEIDISGADLRDYVSARVRLLPFDFRQSD